MQETGLQRDAQRRIDRNGKDESVKKSASGVSFFRVFGRIFAILFLLFSLGFFAWGLFMSGRTVFLQSVCAEDVTRGFDFGPIWLDSGRNYRARLGMIIPDSEMFWETTFTVLDAGMAPVESETVFLDVTQPEFAPGRHTVRDNYFILNGSSGWHFFRFKQVSGTYPAPGTRGAPVASFELRRGIVEPKLCFLVLISGLAIAAILIFLTR